MQKEKPPQLLATVRGRVRQVLNNLADNQGADMPSLANRLSPCNPLSLVGVAGATH
jgi:hypothetical protein